MPTSNCANRPGAARLCSATCAGAGATTGGVNRLKNFFCFTRKEIQARGYDLDVTKLTINVTRTGMTGYQIEDILTKDYNSQSDCADIFNLIAIMGRMAAYTDRTVTWDELMKSKEKLDAHLGGIKA